MSTDLIKVRVKKLSNGHEIQEIDDRGNSVGGTQIYDALSTHVFTVLGTHDFGDDGMYQYSVPKAQAIYGWAT